VTEKVRSFSVPLDRETGFVLKCVKLRESEAKKASLWFQKEMFFAIFKGHPSVPSETVVNGACDEPCLVTHLEELPPGVHREVFAIAFAGRLEFFWRHPIILSAKLLLVRDGPTSSQKAPKILKREALDTQRLRNKPADREGRRKALAAQFIRPKSRLALHVVGVWKELGDHRPVSGNFSLAGREKGGEEGGALGHGVDNEVLVGGVSAVTYCAEAVEGGNAEGASEVTVGAAAGRGFAE